ncbi:MFS transporter [Sphingobacterium sp. E70]|uniref:MFS transporter n=1 Tax=Sphingobacterium sp. E70 TaxID=2853439 RepID=UPI002795B171|nr:MFS transporter [Sphingobacterium sp. E70]
MDCCLLLQHENRNKKAAIGFIFVTLLIDITGWGIILPVVPKLIQELIHADISEAATYGGWLGFAYAFTQFLFSPIVGNLSDRYGRRPIILISLFGFAVDYIFLALAPDKLAISGKGNCRGYRCQHVDRQCVYSGHINR